MNLSPKGLLVNLAAKCHLNKLRKLLYSVPLGGGYMFILFGKPCFALLFLFCIDVICCYCSSLLLIATLCCNNIGFSPKK